MRKMNGGRSDSAFTLVEVLVVIGVIALLAAILFPVFISVRERGRQAACLSHQRQIGLALHLYADDDDGVLPPYQIATKDSTVLWPDLLVPYTKGADVFSCPSDPYPLTYDTRTPCSVGLNTRVGGEFYLKVTAIPSKNMAAILSPSATVMVADTGTDAALGVAPDKWPLIKPNPCSFEDVSFLAANFPGSGGRRAVAPSSPHSGLCDVLFVDGHVKALRVKDFYNGPGVTGPGETVPGYSPCLDPARGCS